jgi:N-acetylglucosamine-6-phosphate deacetylase
VSKQLIIGRDPASGQCIQIAVDDGIITSIKACDAPTDLWISAGLIDLQVNGYAGLDCNDLTATAEMIPQLARAMLAIGVTTFAPTVITASESDILNLLALIAAGRASDVVAQKYIPFIHVEGPSISPLEGYRGAHRESCVRPPSLAEFGRWQEACGGLVGLVTLSPHFDGSDEYIAALVARGVHVSIGHSHATQEQIQRAVDAGARLSTHLGNGIAPLLQRHPNPIWSQLADDRLTACFIADGHHLPSETLKVMVRAKGLDRSILVSDTVALSGMPPGHYVTPVGGRVELSADGRLSVEGTPTLAGSAIPLVECIGRAVRMTGRPLAEVLTMATENPGRFVGNRGRLRVGERADILRFRWTDRVNVEDVWLAGTLAYSATTQMT